jgi:alkylhydroperoxidase family enzyme
MPPPPLNSAEPLDTRTVARALAPAPDIARAYEALWEAVWEQPHVPASVLELCRLRIAQMQGATAELAVRTPQAERAGLDPAKVSALLHGRSAAGRHFTAGERVALEFAELHTMDPAAITDELAAEVKAQFGERGLVALIEALGFIDARLRMARLLPQLDLESRA